MPVESRGGTSWRRMDLLALRARVPYPLMDIYILAAADSGRSGLPIRVAPPDLGEGPHLNYALQWVGIATAVLAFGLFVILGLGRRPLMPGPPPPHSGG